MARVVTTDFAEYKAYVERQRARAAVPADLPIPDCHRNQGASITGGNARGYAVPCWGRRCPACGPIRADVLGKDIRTFYGERAWYALTSKTEHKRLRSQITSAKITHDAELSSFPTGLSLYHSISLVELPGMAWVELTDELIAQITTEWHTAEKGRRSLWSKAFGKAMTDCCSTPIGKSDTDAQHIILPAETTWQSIEYAAQMHNVTLAGTHASWHTTGGDIWGMMGALGGIAPGYVHITEAEPLPNLLPVPF